MANQGARGGLVIVIDDEQSARRGLKRLLNSAGYETELFQSAADFLARPREFRPSCVIVDVCMPGMTGLELQEVLIRRRQQEQLVFITGYGDVPTCSRAFSAGAVDFLPKPIKRRELLKCVERALARSAEERQHLKERNEARRRLDLLTPRQLEAMQLLITGMLCKQVAAELGITLSTAKAHRFMLMHRLGVTSIPQLMRLADTAAVPPAQHSGG